MEFLIQLWMPILLSAVFVFIISSIIHMVLPFHRGDVKKLPNEDAVLDALRANGVAPGDYMFPCAGSMKEMSSPEMLEKCKRGPCGRLSVLPGAFNIGRSLVWWFIYCLLVGILTAYVGWHALDGAAPHYRLVFRITGTAAILGYALGHMHDSIWKGARWSVTIKFIVDGIIYGLVTAGTFGWLWPTGE